MVKKEKTWQVLDSEYLFRRPWLTARRDHVKLPNGTENEEYYVLEYSDWVNVIALTTDGEMLLIRQYRHGIGETHLELVAGVVDPTDDTPLDAARRELMEETGYGGGTWYEFMVLAPNASAMNNHCHTFVAVGVERLSAQHLEPTEDIDVVLMSRSRVRELLACGDELVQALMAAPLWKFFASFPVGQEDGEDVKRRLEQMRPAGRVSP